MNLIIGLILVGLVLLFFEVIIPGGILGILAALCMLAAIILAFTDYGPMEGILTLITSIILTIGIILIQLKLLPKTRLGKQFFLRNAIREKSNPSLGNDQLIGKTGEAITILAPSGKIQIEGALYEAFSRDGLIKKGETLKVTGRDNFRIIVKKLQNQD